MKEVICTWCGDPGASVARHDAADCLHHFHGPCWRAQLAWLRGHSPPAKPGKAWSRGTPKAYRGLKPLTKSARRERAA